MESNQDTTIDTVLAKAITRREVRDSITIECDYKTKCAIKTALTVETCRDVYIFALLIDKDDKPRLGFKRSFNRDCILADWTIRDVITYAVDTDNSFFDALYELAKDYMTDWFCGILGVE